METSRTSVVGSANASKDIFVFGKGHRRQTVMRNSWGWPWKLALVQSSIVLWWTSCWETHMHLLALKERLPGDPSVSVLPPAFSHCLNKRVKRVRLRGDGSRLLEPNWRSQQISWVSGSQRSETQWGLLLDLLLICKAAAPLAQAALGVESPIRVAALIRCVRWGINNTYFYLFILPWSWLVWVLHLTAVTTDSFEHLTASKPAIPRLSWKPLCTVARQNAVQLRRNQLLEFS